MTYVFLTGWLILPSCPLRQYHFVNERLTWHEAQAYCRETYTDLATTESMTEINQLIDTVSSSGYNSEVWIGLYNEIDWRWSDGFTGSGAEYRNWGSREPSFMNADEFCVGVRSTARWHDMSCLDKGPLDCYHT
uniref:C-type lectin domain-containing protein n=1 Tax=Stegastes partitus TaxID=144197 RepID=A0A3B4Z278_9TELE